MSPRRITWTATATLLLLSLACSLPSLTSPFARATPTPTPLPPLPPTLVDTDPMQGEELDPSGPLTLYFDQAMDRASVEAALSVEPAFAPTLTWVDDATLDLRPVTPLPRDTGYRLTLAASARSAAGLTLREPFVLTLHTAAPLRVVQVVPEAETTEVDPGTLITVVFNRPVVALGPEGAKPAPLTFNPPVAGEGQWLDTGIYVFRPTRPLPGGTRLTGTVAAGLQDLTGAPLEQDFTWSFSTAMPQVIHAEPARDGHPVGLDARIIVRFNQAMDRLRVERAFTLRDAAGHKQLGTFTWTEDSTEFAFQPSTRLEYGTSYEARLEASAASPSGSSLGSALVLPFRTAGRPAVIASVPADNGQKDEWESVQLTFAGPMDLASLRRALTISPAVENLSTWWDRDGYILTVSASFDPSRTYTLSLAASASDAFGTPLGAPFSLRFSTMDLSAVSGFMRYSPVLSLDASRPPVIQVQARNASQLGFRLYRLSLPQFFGLLSSGIYAAADAPVGELLRSWEVSVPAARNVMQTLNLSLQSERLPTGVYLLLMTGPYFQGDRTEARLVVVRDTELVIKAAHDEALVWAVDLRSGQPVPSRPLDIVNESGNTIARGTTADDGTASIRFTPAADDYAPTLAVTGRPGESGFGIASTTWAEEIYPYTFGVDYDPTPAERRLYLYTDRPIYRPGQTVFFRGVLRAVDDARYALPPEASIEVRLLDGFGQETGKAELKLNGYGAFSGSFELPSRAALGIYTLDAGLGSVSITVAAYRKPEFEITVEPSAADVGVGDPLTAVVQGKYYFGGPVADASVRWTAWAQPFYPPDLPQPIDWLAYAEGLSYDSGQMLAEGEGQTDAQGQLRITLPTTPEASGGLRVTLTAVLTDSAGLPVQGEGSFRLHPAGVYFGLDPDSYAVASGTSTPVTVSAVDWSNAPVAGQTATLNLDRLTWTQTVADDGTFGWEEQAERLSQSSLTMDARGQAVYTFRPERPGTYRLRVQGKDAQGRTASSSLTLWVYGAEAFSWRSPGTNRIALVADQERYQPGETARILIPSPFDQPVQALVTLERGRILSHRVIEVPAGQTTVDLPLDDSHLPNVYVSAVLIRPASGSAPAELAAGLIGLRVSAAGRELNVTVTPDREQVGPREEVTYRLQATDAQGKPVEAEFSLALVDKSVLALTEPNTTDPFTAFYSPFPLGVITGAALAVSGERGEGLMLATDGRGGGGEDALEPTVRTEFPDTAYWSARVLTDARGEAQVTVRLPDSLTTWRMDARGATQDTRVGDAISELTVTKTLLIRPVTPRFFTAGDAARVAAVVNNNTSQPLKVDVRLEVDGAQLISDARQTAEVPGLGQTRVEWSIEVEDAQGVALTFYAQSGDLEDASTPTIGSTVDGRIPVVRYSAPDTFGTSGGLDRPGERLEAISLPRRFDATQGGLTVTLEPSLGAAMETALDVLEAFPYECTEQVASRFLPNLAAYRAAQALNTEIPGLQGSLQSTVQEGVQTLVARQQYDGGWAWWNQGPTNAYLSAYVLYALLEARDSGFEISGYVIDSAIGYLQSQLGSVDILSDPALRNRQAFLAFVLGRAGSPDTGVLRSLFSARAGTSLWARASMALAISGALPGDPSVATLLSELNGAAVRSATGVHWQDDEPDLWNMGAPVRTTAQVLMALVELEPQNAFASDAVRWLLAARQRDGGWESTHDMAWALMGITRWAAASGSLDSAFAFGATLNTQPLSAGTAPSATLSSFTPIDQLFRDRPNQLLITRGTGTGTLFYTAHLAVYRPVEDVPATSRGLTVSREYFLYDGACGSLEKPCAPAPSAHTGDTLLGRITLTVSSDEYYVVVEDPFPAGMEPIDGSLLTSPTGMPPEMLPRAQTDRVGWRWWYFNRSEMRDDRLVLFADHLPAGTYQYTYLLSAVLAGEYRVLPTRAWAFYFPEVYGHSSGRVYTIQP